MWDLFGAASSVLYAVAIVVMFGTIYLTGLFAAAHVLASRRIRKMDANKYRRTIVEHDDSFMYVVSRDHFDEHQIKRDRRMVITESLWLAVLWPAWSPFWLVIGIVRWIAGKLLRSVRRSVAEPLVRNLDTQVGLSPVELKIENERLKAEQSRQREELERLEKIEAERDDIAEALAREEKQRKETSTV